MELVISENVFVQIIKYEFISVKLHAGGVSFPDDAVFGSVQISEPFNAVKLEGMLLTVHGKMSHNSGKSNIRRLAAPEKACTVIGNSVAVGAPRSLGKNEAAEFVVVVSFEEQARKRADNDSENAYKSDHDFRFLLQN